MFVLNLNVIVFEILKFKLKGWINNLFLLLKNSLLHLNLNLKISFNFRKDLHKLESDFEK